MNTGKSVQEPLVNAFNAMVTFAAAFEHEWDHKIGDDELTADYWGSALRSIHALMKDNNVPMPQAYGAALATAGMNAGARHLQLRA